MVGAVTGNSITWGVQQSFRNGNINNVSAAYDPVNNKIVIVYSDASNSSRGTAIICTINPANNTATFGTPVIFSTAVTGTTAISWDSTSQKMVVSYGDNGNSRTSAIVGTVSGTSISFGSATVIDNIVPNYISSTYDTINNRTAVSYIDFAAGTTGFAGPISISIGTVSGTSITFGTPVPVQFGATSEALVHASAYDPINNRVVLTFYYDTVDANRRFPLGAIAGEITGTTITFGTYIDVRGDRVVGGPSIVYDPVSGNMVTFCYVNIDASTGPTVADILSLSGSVITVPSASVNISTGANVSAQSWAVYDTANQRIVMVTNNSGGSSTAYSVVYRPALATLAVDNFIGFSVGNYTAGQISKVEIISAINTTQTGLTPGKKYYVQPAGTLSITPGTPNVYAGLAVTSTKLIIKG
jgi:hypothetical protein